jgi:two-component system OmpR family sensor kinase
LSLAARLLLVLAALTVAGIVAVDLATYAAVRSFLIDRVDGSLAANARALERSLSHHRHGPGRELDALAAELPGVFVELRDETGAIVWSGVFRGRGEASPLPQLPERISEAGGADPFNVTVPAERGDTEFRARIEPLRSGWSLVVAEPLDDVSATLHRLAVIELLVSLAVAAAVVGLGLRLVRLGLRPLRGIEETAAAIAAGDLGRRIGDASGRTEVGRLGLALNRMLERIEEAFAERAASERRLRSFVADASHELRTPLASVRAYAELFEHGARERPQDLARALAGIERESRRMGALVDDLLLLARLDQGRPLEREPVDLRALAVEAVDAAQALEPERPIRLDAPEAVSVVGDRARLRQILDNLLANVRAHVPPSAPATVRVRGEDDLAVVEVSDEGRGLDEAERARVFERFYRGEPSRARGSGGSGLGLAIVAALAEAHGGQVAVASEPGRGARFCVLLPPDS